MITIFIEGRKHRTMAFAKYDENSKEVVVLKGSIVSDYITNFTHKEKIENMRRELVDSEGVLKKDIIFKNPTSAAQFVCGYSVSGYHAWHVEKHKALVTWMEENKEG